MELNPEQQRAVDHIEGPILIIAGAGSGKTGVITHRILNLLAHDIPQSAILALTFTNKAATEMRERVKERSGKKMTNLNISTFHSFGMELLRRYGHLLGYKPNFTIYDAPDQLSCLKNASLELKLPYDHSDLKTLAELFSKIKSRQLQWDGGSEQHKELFNEYQEHLKLYNAVDFDDLIAQSVNLLENNAEVLEDVQNRYKYIMVDEFQDTSMLQYHFIDLIAKKYRNLCCVGDDDQSIYSWRGANYANITNFEKDYPERLEVKLEQNYRSTGNILKAANAIIANNTNRKEKELWTNLTSDDVAIHLRYPEDNFDEADFIGDHILNIHRDKEIAYQDFGILVRTNTLVRVLEDALLKSNIPYTVTGGQSFFQRQEIKDVIAYLRIIVNPDDDVNLRRIINTPRRGIGRRSLEMINDHAERNKHSLYSSIATIVFDDQVVPSLSKAAKDGLAEFYNIIESARSNFFQPKINIGEKIQSLVDEVDYFAYLIQEYSDNDKIAKWKYDNIKFFVEMCERWQKNPDLIDPTLINWLNRITLITRSDGNDDQQGKVNLMTIHASKGLEFKVVFLVGLEEGILPHARSLEDYGEVGLEEERRLFYVAVTRAQEQLFLSSCLTRKVRDETKAQQPSSFLEEIPKELVSQVTLEELEEEESRAIAKALENLPWRRKKKEEDLLNSID